MLRSHSTLRGDLTAREKNFVSRVNIVSQQLWQMQDKLRLIEATQAETLFLPPLARTYEEARQRLDQNTALYEAVIKYSNITRIGDERWPNLGDAIYQQPRSKQQYLDWLVVQKNEMIQESIAIGKIIEAVAALPKQRTNALSRVATWIGNYSKFSGPFAFLALTTGIIFPYALPVFLLLAIAIAASPTIQTFVETHAAKLGAFMMVLALLVIAAPTLGASLIPKIANFFASLPNYYMPVLDFVMSKWTLGLLDAYLYTLGALMGGLTTLGFIIKGAKGCFGGDSYAAADGGVASHLDVDSPHGLATLAFHPDLSVMVEHNNYFEGGRLDHDGSTPVVSPGGRGGDDSPTRTPQVRGWAPSFHGAPTTPSPQGRGAALPPPTLGSFAPTTTAGAKL
ncbi:hypothetical protein BH10PSE19_BH10PSE19_11000 [soil metagenome]